MHTKTRRRGLFLVSVVVGLGLLTAGPAFAQDNSGSAQVVIKGRVVVAPGETDSTVVIVDGPVLVAGTVTGSVVAIHGPVTISGKVEGSVISVSDRVTLLSGARVDGDVRSQKHAAIAPGASVGGSVGGIDFSRFNQAAWISRYVWWFGVTVSTLLIGLLILAFPQRAQDALRSAAGRTWPSIGWGLIWFFGLPIAAVILCITIIGLPLGLALLFALGLIYLIGYVAAAWWLGALVASRASRFVAFLAGWGILRGVALIPFLSGLVWTLATIFGLGLITIAAWSRRGAMVAVPAPVMAAPPAVPPVPPPPSTEV
jgi:cytoskeletal protein CcmA (bactofilin family)